MDKDSVRLEKLRALFTCFSQDNGREPKDGAEFGEWYRKADFPRKENGEIDIDIAHSQAKSIDEKSSSLQNSKYSAIEKYLSEYENAQSKALNKILEHFYGDGPYYMGDIEDLIRGGQVPRDKGNDIDPFEVLDTDEIDSLFRN